MRAESQEFRAVLAGDGTGWDPDVRVRFPLALPIQPRIYAAFMFQYGRVLLKVLLAPGLLDPRRPNALFAPSQVRLKPLALPGVAGMDRIALHR